MMYLPDRLEPPRRGIRGSAERPQRGAGQVSDGRMRAAKGLLRRRRTGKAVTHDPRHDPGRARIHKPPERRHGRGRAVTSTAAELQRGQRAVRRSAGLRWDGGGGAHPTVEPISPRPSPRRAPPGTAAPGPQVRSSGLEGVSCDEAGAGERPSQAGYRVSLSIWGSFEDASGWLAATPVRGAAQDSPTKHTLLSVHTGPSASIPVGRSATEGPVGETGYRLKLF